MNSSKLRSMRKEAGLTQAELAFRVGIHSNTLARLERGDRTLRKPIQMAINSVLLEATKTGAL